MQNETEITAHRIEGTDIIFQKIKGELTTEKAEELYKKTDNIAHTLDNPNAIKILVDTSESKKATPDARRRLNTTLKNDNIKKIAVIGIQPFLRAELFFLQDCVWYR